VAVWYLDSEQEITEAVARLRGATDERVVFVVPPGSRIATGRINFKLLAREAEARGLHLAIASPDAQVRAMAASAGVLARPSTADAEAALERGDSAASEIAPDGAGEAGALAGTAGDDAGAATGVATAATPQRATILGRSARRVAFVVVAVMTVAVVGVVATLQNVPTARIVLSPRTVPLGPLAITVTAVADLEAPDLEARLVPAVTLPVPLSLEWTYGATGERASKARARGQVLFTAPLAREGVVIPALTGVFAGDVEFRTTETTYLRPTDDGTSVDALASVEAVVDGAAGNVAAGAIDAVPSLAAQGIEVTNPEATAGGHLEESLVVTRADYDAAAVDLQNRLAGALTTFQQEPTGIPEGLSVFAETARPLGISFEPPADELVGASADEFRLTGTMDAEVLAVDEEAIRAMLASALAEEVPRGMAVLPDTLSLETYGGTVEGAGIRFDGQARAVAQQVIDEDDILARVAGLPVSEARAILEEIGATTVSVWPEFLGDLPGDQSRIRLEVRAPSTTE
jgi:hypothetical protein